jgi:hypothetical protein
LGGDREIVWEVADLAVCEKSIVWLRVILWVKNALKVKFSSSLAFAKAYSLM